MWSTEHSVETSASPEAVWRLWADVPRWPEWNADLARAELDGEPRPWSRNASSTRRSSAGSL
jgi:uncharacterized membrane protein